MNLPRPRTLAEYDEQERLLEAVHVGPRVTCRCWMCGATRRRRRYDHVRVVGKRTILRRYGCCPADGPGGVPCRGAMVAASEVRRVVRAAVQHERRGGNRRSEYDA